MHNILLRWIRTIRRVVDSSLRNAGSDLLIEENSKESSIKTEIPADEAWESLKKEANVFGFNETLRTNPLAYTQRVSFELSNLCNYANIHKKCPLAFAREPETLPSKVVFDILRYIGEKGFTGRISFHNYNEPLLDPRLFSFIQYARQQCPGSDVYICTNGYHLTQELADELVASGVSNIHVSGYSRVEIDRLNRIQLDIPYKVVPMRLDDTLKVYERPFTNCSKPCFAPLNEIIITSDAQMSLCCLDWRRIYSLGDLRFHSLEALIYSDNVQMVYQKLSKGERILDICRRCDWTR